MAKHSRGLHLEWKMVCGNPPNFSPTKPLLFTLHCVFGIQFKSINTKTFIIITIITLGNSSLTFDRNNIRFFIMYLSVIVYGYYSYLITVRHIT